MISCRLHFELRGRAKAVKFFVAYALTETHNASNKHAFWTNLDRAVKDVPRHEQLFVFMDANARTGRREKRGVGSKDNNMPTAEIPSTTTENYSCSLLTTTT